MTDMHKAIPLDEVFEALDETKPRKSAKHRAGIAAWQVEEAALRAYNQERAPERAVRHTLSLVGDLLNDVAEGDADPATFATLTALVGTLQKLRRIY